MESLSRDPGSPGFERATEVHDNGPVMTPTWPDSMAALQARAVAKRYRGGVRALDGIDLDIPLASITALVGPNGAGKSTLMKAWVGFERPSRGSVAVLGVDPWRCIGV